jgi:hypothetical protein
MRTFKIAAALAGIAAVLAIVGGPAAIASYGHAIETARKYGETGPVVEWLPLTTDGMLLAALVVMYARRWRAEPIGFVPKLAFVTGSVATLAANLSSADLAGPLAAGDIGEVAGRLAVAAWPPIAFAVTLELIAVMLGFLRRTVDTDQVWPVTHMIGLPVWPSPSPAALDVEAAAALVPSLTVEQDAPHWTYRLFDETGDLLYVGATNGLRHRLGEHRRERHWWPEVHSVSVVEYSRRADALHAEATAIRTEGPRYNVNPHVVGVLAGPTPKPIRTSKRKPVREAVPTMPANNGEVYWTESDEAVRMELQNEINDGGPMPSVRKVKTRFSMSQERATRIIRKLTPRTAPADDTESETV